MNRLITSVVVGTIVALAGGCSTSQKAEAPAPAACMLPAPMSNLVGEWMTTDEKGVKTLASVITVSSSGSVLREVMFPGSGHEMTNMYHMDGDSIVLTHYCAIGNQPRMKAKPSPHQIDFQFESVTNRKPADQVYMGRCVIKFVDANTLDIDWTSYKDGKESSHQPFHWTRK